MIIAKSKCEELKSSFWVDTSIFPDTCAVRAMEKEMSLPFKLTRRVLTVEGMRDNSYYRINENSFSRCRSRFDEFGRVSLTEKREICGERSK